VHPLIQENLTALTELCRRFRVYRLELFGSATGKRFDPARSDIDFLVEFEPAQSGFGERYLGLLESLEDLFGRHVDLVETKAITNPYFLQSIQASREVLYAA
jgi:hypothetical protein